MTTPNIALKVPFNEKDQAKALGARWNAELKQWYVPQGMNAAPFEKWFTHSPAPTKEAVKGATQQAALHHHVADEDIDAINAQLREAFEFREFDEM